MSVVVSDTSPLHYLILCGAENILPGRFQQVVIPPAVFNAETQRGGAATEGTILNAETQRKRGETQRRRT